MRRQWFIVVSLLFAFSVLSLSIVSSQPGQSGMINGTVKDPNGAVVAGAQVTVRNEATGETRDAVTDNQGRFKIEGLAPGGYKLTINRDGFKTAERAVSVESGKAATVESKLEIAATRAEITGVFHPGFIARVEQCQSVVAGRDEFIHRSVAGAPAGDAQRPVRVRTGLRVVRRARQVPRKRFEFADAAPVQIRARWLEHRDARFRVVALFK